MVVVILAVVLELYKCSGKWDLQAPSVLTTFLQLRIRSDG